MSIHRKTHKAETLLSFLSFTRDWIKVLLKSQFVHSFELRLNHQPNKILEKPITSEIVPSNESNLITKKGFNSQWSYISSGPVYWRRTQWSSKRFNPPIGHLCTGTFNVSLKRAWLYMSVLLLIGWHTVKIEVNSGFQILDLGNWWESTWHDKIVCKWVAWAAMRHSQ